MSELTSKELSGPIEVMSCDHSLLGTQVKPCPWCEIERLQAGVKMLESVIAARDEKREIIEAFLQQGDFSSPHWLGERARALLAASAHEPQPAASNEQVPKRPEPRQHDCQYLIDYYDQDQADTFMDWQAAEMERLQADVDILQSRLGSVAVRRAELERELADTREAYLNQSARLVKADSAHEPETGHWYCGEDIDALVRELDVWLNGEDGAAKQAKLCDVVAQITRSTQPPPVEQDTEALVWAQRVHEDLAKYTQEDGQMIHVRANRALGILFTEIERLEKALYPGLTKRSDAG